MDNPGLVPFAALRGVRKGYGTVVALAGVDLVLAPGTLHALLGPNGAGKTTAIGLMLGLIRPDLGHAELFGEDPQHVAPRRRVGVMLQTGSLPETLRVGELLRQASGYYPRPRAVEESARMAGITDLLARPYGRLSGGQQRRVQFALALCGKPDLLFLDEPTVGLDIEARQGLWATIRSLVAEGCGVLLTTHYLEEAEALADRVTVLGQGRVLAEGTVAEIRGRTRRTRIRCRSMLRADEVRAWDGVHAAVHDAGILSVDAREPERVLRRLLAADEGLCELEVSRAGLAEAFTELTREAA